MYEPVVVFGKLFHHGQNGLLSVSAHLRRLLHRCRGATLYLLLLLRAEIPIRKHSLLADAVRHKDLEEVVGDFIELVNAFNMGSHNGFLLFEDPNGSIHLHIPQIVVVEVFEGHGDFIFALLVENYFENACVVVDFEEGAHRFFLLGNHSADNYYIVDGLALDLAHIIGSRGRLLYHFHRHRGEDAVLSALATFLLALAFVHLVGISGALASEAVIHI